MATNPSTPTLARLGLGRMITRIRVRSGKERSQVAAELGTDPETVRRWETGVNAPKKMAITALAESIGATPEERSRMNTLSLESKDRGIFEGNNVPPDLRVLYETEYTASLIRSLELEHIPGLLQTPEYHVAVQEALLSVEPERAETFRKLRTRRQEIVFGRSPLPRMLFIIGPAALFYLESLPDIRSKQLARLREANAMPGVEIRVITGLHASMLGSFTILTPPRETGARPFVYVEDIDGGRYVEGDVVSQYEAVFSTVGDGQSQELEEYLC